MSLIESDPCQGNCEDCDMCDPPPEARTIEVKIEDLERIAEIALCDEIREITWKHINHEA